MRSAICCSRRSRERLTDCLREEDTAARLGGDEFIISLPDVADAGEAARVASRILAELAKPFTIADHQLHADGSIGIALYPADGDTAETLMRNADTAMYHAKESGRAQLPVLQRADDRAGQPAPLDRDATCAARSSTASSRCITSR